MAYRRVGSSGLLLPAISLGLWQNFGDDRPLSTQRAIVLRAFDRGVTHFDFGNNYGPPPGSAEENFGRILGSDLGSYRDELVISTKAGYDMWPGPYGVGGSRKYLLASLDQSLGRMGLDYVDIFYSHRFDAETPLEETMGALDTAVRQGKALYVGISSYSAKRTSEAAAILRGLGTPLLIHQPSYSMLNRWIEPDLLDVLAEERMGAIAFSPLAQGLLTDRYLGGVPDGSRATQGGSFSKDLLTDANLANVRGLNEIAQATGPDPRPDGARLDPARPASRVSAGRRELGRAARRQPHGTRKPGLRAGRAKGDRPVRGRGQRQPVGAVEQRLERDAQGPRTPQPTISRRRPAFIKGGWMAARRAGERSTTSRPQRAYTIRDQVALRRLHDFVVSPDGSRLILEIERAVPGRNRLDTHLWSIRADGTGLRRLTRSRGRESNPAFAPDGRSVYFLAGSHTGDRRVMRLAFEGGKPIPVTRSPVDIESFVCLAMAHPWRSRHRSSRAVPTRSGRRPND